MAFQNNPDFLLAVPADAAPGIPGIKITDEIPAPITAYYALQGMTVSAVTLHFIEATNSYYYDAIIVGGGDSYRVSGTNLNNVIMEFRRESSSLPPAKGLRDMQSAVCDLATNPTLATFSNLSGAVVTMTLPANVDVFWECDYAADMDQNTGTNTVTVVQLVLDNGGTYPQCIFCPGNTSTVTPTQRAGGLSQHAQGIISASPTVDAHTWRLQCARAQGAGTNRINALHTGLDVKVYY